MKIAIHADIDAYSCSNNRISVTIDGVKTLDVDVTSKEPVAEETVPYNSVPTAEPAEVEEKKEKEEK